MPQNKACMLLTVFAAVVAYTTAAAQQNDQEIQGRQNIVTTTVTVTSVQYLTSGVNYVCASLVNVTGACRRRRGVYIDNPIFFAFDDDIQDEVEKYFSPTGVYRVEPTTGPESRSNNRFNAFDAQHQGASIKAIEPSQQQLFWNPFYSVQPRIPNPVFFSQIASFVSNLGTPAVTQTATVTSVITKVTTSTTSTRPFIVNGCTPSPFPYKQC